MRTASAASTPTNIQDSDSAMPDADDENTVKASPSLKSPINSSAAPSMGSAKKPHKEPVIDEWTDEQDTSLFKGLVHWKPVGKALVHYYQETLLTQLGMHRHFRMIALSKYLRNHGYDPEIETHTRPAGIWAHLEKYFDLETLGQREDHIDDDPADPQYLEFALPADYDEMKWQQGNVELSRKRNAPTVKQMLQDEGDDQNTEDDQIMTSREVEEDNWNSSPAQFDPSAIDLTATPPPNKKRKRGDTITRTRGSTVEDTDDARSSINSPAAALLPTASSTRSARSNKRAAKAASTSSRQASKDITADEEESHAGDDETDDTASVRATTRSNAKAAKGATQVTTRKSGRKR